MKAIITKYHGPTNARPAHITAQDSDRNRARVSRGAGRVEDDHDAAAVALCRKMGWTDHNLVRGGLDGDTVVYVFEHDSNRVEVKP